MTIAIDTTGLVAVALGVAMLAHGCVLVMMAYDDLPTEAWAIVINTVGIAWWAWLLYRLGAGVGT